MKTLKAKVWKRVLAVNDWGTKFSLLLDQDNYEDNEKYKSKISETRKCHAERRGVCESAKGN